MLEWTSVAAYVAGGGTLSYGLWWFWNAGGEDFRTLNQGELRGLEYAAMMQSLQLGRIQAGLLMILGALLLILGRLLQLR